MEPTLSSETSAFILRTPGKFPKEHRLHSEHGESLKTTKMVHVSSGEIKRWYRESVEFFQHINAEKKPDVMCSTCRVALCKTACFGEYKTRTHTQNYWTGRQKFNMIPDLILFLKILSWNIICFEVKGDLNVAILLCLFLTIYFTYNSVNKTIKEYSFRL